MVRCLLAFVIGSACLSFGFRPADSGDPALQARLAEFFPDVETGQLAEAIRQQDQEYDERRAQRDAYAAFTERLVRELLDGRCCLANASERLFYHCLLHNPRSLEHICQVEPGKHPKTRVAHNLLRDIHSYVRDHPRDEAAPCRLVALEQELSELPYDDEGRRPF